MMGNLSPDLKNHAVTMFEVGKLCDESIDSFLEELDKIGWQDIEGEAKRYWTHALVLRSALRALAPLRPMDLVRCESLQSLDAATVARLLNNKYKLLATMAPLSREVRPPQGPPHTPPILGPSPPETNSLWFKLYIYHITGYGPPTLLLTKGTAIKTLPRLFLGFSRLLVSSWQHESVVLPTCNFLAINATLKYSPVMIQAYGVRDVASTTLVSFPPPDDKNDPKALWWDHSALRRLGNKIDLQHSCGYISMVDIGVPDWGIDIITNDVILTRNSSAVSKAKALQNAEDCLSDDERLKQELSKKLELEDGIKTENPLQSPNESHFALTPLTQSKTHSPANGFTSVDCSTILCQELDRLEQRLENESFSDDNFSNLEVKEAPIKLENIDSLLSPTEENIPMFPQLPLDENEDKKSVTAECENRPKEVLDLRSFKKEKWTLLECHFGIPLFDEEINQNICNSLVTKLSNPDSLEKLTHSNKSLSENLLMFISQCQYFPGEDIGIVKRGPLIPLPKKNLIFENGKISMWTLK